MRSQRRLWPRTRSWASLVLALLYLLALHGALAADEPAGINPLGITFDYKLGWVDVEKSTFGASIQATAQPSYVDGTAWSLLVRFAQDAQANVTGISPGWGLGVYDYASWVLLPGPAPFEPLRLTIRSSSNMAQESAVVKYAQPVSLILVPAGRPSAESSGYTLVSGRDYSVDTDVNLAELPKAAFGAWLSLAAADAAPPPSPTTTATGAHPSSSALPMGGSDTPAEETDAPMATVLPPVKYIKGDPDYDPEADPIGTVLSAPLVGPYLVNTILGIGILTHIAGTVRRLQFKRQYQMSVMRSRAASSLA
ncbi:hypothetical protein LPJ61_002472 [Coemansia biformis]|uniref:Glucodextranase-like C-terminal domain-containing protein n=1 Tax=Coemansia biformis TaxID=1286918 RepID=A0A9W7YE05_9FUNG|nr:hypothetical protein LPJ61_002472 [Coemansia biformis]